MRVIFDPIQHKYFDETKREYPSVTKILNHFGLSDYSKVDPYLLEASQKFGTAVHKVCELHDKNDLGDYDGGLEPYLNGYKLFLEHFKPEWKLIEKPLISRIWGFAGTPDRFGVTNKNVLIDLKTGTKEPSHEIQTGAYEVLIEENLREKIKERYSLYLLPNDFKLEPHKQKSDKTLFIGLAQSYIWKRNHKLIKD